MNKINSFLLLKDGAEIAYKIDGKVGPPVALVSGLGGGYQFWNEVSAILSSNYRVISFDQRGIGSSSRGKLKTSLECLVDDFKQLIDHVFPDQPVNVIGHSTGGVIAQIFASRYPEKLSSLVLSGSWFESDHYMRYLFHLRRTLLNEAPSIYQNLSNILSYNPAVVCEIFWENLETESSMSDCFRELMTNRIDALINYSGDGVVEKITLNTLVIGSRDDQVIPFYHQQKLYNALPYGHLTEIKEGGHFFPKIKAHDYASLVEGWVEDGEKSI